MISFELLRDEGILVVEPKGTLEAADFTALAWLGGNQSGRPTQ